jgi:ethanolamine utilization protein EutL
MQRNRFKNMRLDIQAIPLKPKLLSRQVIHNISPLLAAQYGIKDLNHVSLGLVTCDFDDALYVALDEATKQSPIDVVYAKSFYAGSNHASGPLSGEAIGVIAGRDPSEVATGLQAIADCLLREAWFYQTMGETKVNFFPHVVASCGSYLAKIAEVEEGTSLAYLIAGPVEALIGLDRATKASRVKVSKFYGPPTETNFAGALLTGEQTECEYAARVFAESVLDVAEKPIRES